MRNVLLLTLAIGACACSRRAEPAATPAPARTPASTPTSARPPAARTEPARSATVPASRSISGSYRFTAVNQSRVPAEFPPGSGARLESGTLDLTANDRFAMRFAARAGGATETVTSGEDGRYRIAGDTLYFYVDGRAAPVVFRFVRTADGLRLIDTKGNSWVYVRK